MEKDMRYYPVKQVKLGTNVEEKYILGEIYKEIFGIQPAKTLKRDLCFQITHIPTGYLLTNLYFSKIIDAKRYLDWVTKDILDKLSEADPDKLSNNLRNSPRIKKQKKLEFTYGDKAIVFES